MRINSWCSNLKDFEMGQMSETEIFLEEMYLDYFNDFLTVAVFAEHHGISESEAAWAIDEGRKINHRR